MTTNRHAIVGKALHHPECEAFIKGAIVPAQQSELLTGVPAAITIAQAILESGWGKRHMGAANNYFGIKAQVDKKSTINGDVASGYVDLSTREHFNGKDVNVTAHFRAYKNIADSFLDHGLFLKNNSRYNYAIQQYSKTHDADEFARNLQNAGYATDPKYAALLITIMRKNKLYQYNQGQCNSKDYETDEIMSLWV